MKCYLWILLALALSLSLARSFDFEERELDTVETLSSMYERWRAHYGVSRTPDDVMQKRRLTAFRNNAKYVHETNKGGRPYKLKLNSFADMTDEEFTTSMLGGVNYLEHNMLNVPQADGFRNRTANRTLPLSVDWREKGAVTPVKYQGKCGACWAFSAVAAVEGISQIKTKKLVAFSEQELLDCNTERNNACHGGFVELAFQFIQENGLTTECKYPYQVERFTCNRAKVNASVVAIDGYEFVPANDEDALLEAVARQPISVAVDSEDLHFYSEGVFNGPCGTSLNHAVTIVGYGTSSEGIPYWLVKNSWGSNWGEDGYLRLERGISEKEGKCGVAMRSLYPIKLSSTNPNGGGNDTCSVGTSLRKNTTLVALIAVLLWTFSFLTL